MFLINITFLLSIFCFILILLVCVAYLTLAERKILGSIQLREGPSTVGLFGLLQPVSDGLKLILKEIIIPKNSNSALFLISPFFTFSISLFLWAVVPFSNFSFIANIECGALFILALSSFNVYGIILAGWSSNSKYAFIGAIRSSAQIISYEISIGLILLSVLVLVGSLNLTSIVNFQSSVYLIIPCFPLFFLFFISALAETNRTPFDLAEAEAELVAGYNVEYSAIIFSLFFLSEYSNMILISAITVIFFFGGWLPMFSLLSFIPFFIWFSVKICFCLYIFILIRATVPRYRYDQLIGLGWKVFLPISFFYFIMTIFFIKVFI